MRPFDKNERVTWKSQVKGKETKFVGLFQSEKSGKATVLVDGKEVTTLYHKLSRPRGRKPSED